MKNTYNIVNTLGFPKLLAGLCLFVLMSFPGAWISRTLAEEKTPASLPSATPAKLPDGTPSLSLNNTPTPTQTATPAKATPVAGEPTPKAFLPVDIQELEKKGKLAKPPKFSELSPREKMKAKVSVNFQDKNLLEVAACLTVFTGLDVVIDPDVSGHPEKLKKIIVRDLQLSEVPLEQVFTWLCRYLNCEYRMSDKTVFIFRSYAWLKDEPIGVEAFDLTGLYNDVKGEDIIKPIQDILRLPRWFNSSVKVSFVGESSRALVQLPAQETALLRGLLKEMQKSTGGKSPYALDVPPPAPLPEDKERLAFEKKLNGEKFDLTWEGYRRVELLRKIAGDKKIQLGFCQQLYLDEDRLKFKEGNINLKKAFAQILSADSGLKLYGYSGDSAWIGPKNSWYSKTAETLREQVVAHAYPVRDIAGIIGENKMLELIHNYLPSNCLCSPLTRIVYHKPSGCLIVVHLPEIHVQVDYYLKILASVEYKKYIGQSVPVPPAAQ